MHLRQAPKNDDFIAGGSADAGGAMLGYVKEIGADNMRVALQVGLLLKHSRSPAEVATLYGSTAKAELLLVGGYDSGVVENCKGSCDFSQAAVSGMNATLQNRARGLVAAGAKAGAVLVHDAAFLSWEEALDDVAALRS